MNQFEKLKGNTPESEHEFLEFIHASPIMFESGEEAVIAFREFKKTAESDGE